MVGPGYHIALSRENAKRVFAMKGDAELPALIEELKNSPELRKDLLVLESNRTWDALHRCLTEGTLDPAGGELPFNHAVLGGKPLHNGDDYVAVVVRPDMTRFVAEALQSLKESEFRKSYFALADKGYDQPINEKEYALVWKTAQQVRLFFEDCDEERYAVLFTAKWKE